MLNDIKRSLAIICFTLSFVYCNGQISSREFDLFLSNFEKFNFPLIPTEFLFDRADKLQLKNILKKDYDKYLRTEDDTLWMFYDCYEYKYGGKKKMDNYWILFYSRYYSPIENENLFKGEIVLSTFTFDGIMISSIAVAGRYGNYLTFDSVINSSDEILVKYTSNKKDMTTTSTKRYYIGEEHIFKKWGW